MVWIIWHNKINGNLFTCVALFPCELLRCVFIVIIVVVSAADLVVASAIHMTVCSAFTQMKKWLSVIFPCLTLTLPYSPIICLHHQQRGLCQAVLSPTPPAHAQLSPPQLFIDRLPSAYQAQVQPLILINVCIKVKTCWSGTVP